MNLAQWFIHKYPSLVTDMKDCSYHHNNSYNNHHLEGDVWTHTMMALSYAQQNNMPVVVQWAILLHDIGRTYTRNINKETNKLEFGDFEGVSCYLSLDILNKSSLSQTDKVEVLKIISYHYTMIDHMKFDNPTLEELQQQFKYEEIVLKNLSLYSICDLKGRIISDNRKHLYDFSKMQEKIELIENLPQYTQPLTTSKPTVYILIGPPCAGKSSWIKRQNFSEDTIIINRDSCTMKVGAMHGKHTYDEAFSLMQDNPDIKKQVNILDESKEAIAKNTTTANVVIDNPNLKIKNRKEWTEALGKTHHIKGIVFLTSFKTLRERNELRTQQLNKSISKRGLVRKLKTFMFPLLSEGFHSIDYETV